MKIFIYLFAIICAVFLMNVCCFAGAVFRTEGVTDLSAVELLLGDSKMISVKKAPADGQGSLLCQGAELSDNETIYRSELDSLVFVPFCDEYLCSIELLPQGESQPLAITVTNQDCKVSSYSLEAGEYCWAWAKSNYFSHIAKNI